MDSLNSLPTEELVRIDELCAEFEREWKSGGRPSLEGVLSRYADLDRPTVLALLLELELHYRRKRGEVPAREEYLLRFPGSEGVIAAVFDQTQLPPGPLPPARFRHDDPPGYKLLHELGAGGTGVVYLAHEVAADRTVALKLLHCPGRYKAVERLLVEVRSMARLDHPNVVKVIAVEMNRGEPFFTMEYVPGGTLAALTNAKDGRPLPDPADAVRLVLQAAEGVAHAHANGIIHRDLKPGNVLLAGPSAIDEPDPAATTQPRLPVEEATTLPRAGADKTPDREVRRRSLIVVRSLRERGAARGASGLLWAACTAKVSDFGLAKRIDVDDGITTNPAPMGTPAYMSPEAASGKALDGEAGILADVYGLGVTLYHLLTGRPPFEDDRTDGHLRHSRHLEIMRRVVNEEPARPRALRPELPPKLEGIVVKAMEKDPAQRYPSAEAFAEDLRKYLAGEEPAAPPLTRGRRARRWLKRNRGRVALAAAMVAMVLTAAGLTAAWLLAPPPDPLEEIQEELRAGRPVTLIPAAGPPKYARWPLGTPPVSLAADGAFTFEAPRLAWLELLPDPGIDHYSVTANLRILYHKAIILDGKRKGILGADAAQVGLYFGQTTLQTTGEQPAYLSLAASYNDCLTELARKAKITQAMVQVVKNTTLVDPDGLPGYRPGGVSPPLRFESEEQPPGKWRRVRLEVSPAGVKVFWAESDQAPWQLLAELTAEQLTRHLTRMKEELGDKIPPGEAPTWNPRLPVGIWCSGAALSVRDVVVEPLP